MAGRRWYFVVNPLAGNGRTMRRWPRVESLLRAAGIDFEYRCTERQGHAAEIVRGAFAEGYRNFVAVGGDGTANEVANGIMGLAGVPAAEVCFSVLPTGTGNDWVRQHHIPRSLDSWVKYLNNGKPALQDVGWVEYCASEGKVRRHFVNVMGLGYDGYVARAAAAKGGKMASKMSYLLVVLRCMFSYRTPLLRVCFDEQQLTGRIYALVVGINKYSGGGFQLVPHARPDDGLLALTIARKLSHLELLLLSPLFYTGCIGWHPAVSLHQVHHLAVEAPAAEEVMVEADGELLGTLPARMGIAPSALQIWVPQ